MEDLSEAAVSRAAQILTTEHFTLQGARNATISEANGRIGHYISIVGSAVVALAFVANVSKLGPLFFTFSLVLLPVLIVLGFMTLIRTMQISLDYARLVQAINRIRHFYVEVAPEVERYFSFPHHDDRVSTMASMMPFQSRLQGLASTPGPVILINSVLVGAFVAILAVQWLSADLSDALLTALVGLVLALVVHMAYSTMLWSKEGQETMRSRFPTPEA